MKIDIGNILGTISIVFCIATFVLNRKDKAIESKEEQDKESSNQKLIDYRLGQVEKKLDKILDILDSYDAEIDKRVEKAMDQHIKIYHKGAM